MQLIKKIIIKAVLKLETGLHIGDSKDNVEIGGVDSPVVRRKDTNEPYVPGSSLKGKLRGLLEIVMGENADNSFDNYSSEKGKLLERLFGSKNFPARILVRDASMTSESVEKLKDSDFTDMPYTEVKFENVINRLKGTAEHPRQIERVPAGTEFNIEFVINITDDATYKMSEKEKDFIGLLKSGLKLLQDDYIGGSGSRGYGKVSISELDIKEIEAKIYLEPK
jgi:CRISPR-associated protein Csm3